MDSDQIRSTAGLMTLQGTRVTDRVPRLLRQTAKELAGAFYEESRSERFRSNFPTWKKFVGLHWPDFVPPAREILLTMLSNPMTTEHVKKEIYDCVTQQEERTLHSIKGVTPHG